MVRVTRRWRFLVGFGAALTVLAALLWLVGPGETAAAVASADEGSLALVVAATGAWLAAWGLALWTVLSVMGIGLPIRTAVALAAAAQFANNVTPFGQAGGEPVSALLVARTTDTEYEIGLAAVASVDVLNLVPSVAFTLIGLGLYALRFSLGPRLGQLAVVVVGLTVTGVAAGSLGWRHHRTVERVAVPLLAGAARPAARALPGTSPPTERAVRARVRGFVDAVAPVAADRWGLAVALGCSAVGWLALVASLWLSLLALGYAVPVQAALVAVPAAAVAGVTPLPGGLGGVEAVLVAALLLTTSVPAAVAGAAVVIHRLATYWLPVAAGGAATAGLCLGVAGR